MNEMDKKMEEFFQKSMEGFNDAPSDMVWDQLSDQLDSEETVFTKVWKRVRSVLPMAILLLGFGALSLYSYSTINGLKNSNSLLEINNQELNESLSILNHDNKTLENKNKTLHNDIKTQQEQVVGIQQKIKSSQAINNKSIYKHENINKKLQLAEALNMSYEAQLFACANDLNDLSALYTSVVNKQSEILAGKGIIGSPGEGSLDDGNLEKAGDVGNGTLKNQVGEIIAESSRSIGLKIKDFNPLNKMPDFNLSELGDKISLEGLSLEKWKLDNIFAKTAEKELAGKSVTANTREWKYRFGVTGRAYNTFIKEGGNFNFSTSYGVKQELTFRERWSLTHSIEYNEQEYSVKTDTGALSREILDVYPDSPGDYANVRSVKSRSTYFDSQLGIKYQRPSKKGNVAYFVNPSVVWQLYLPQEFNYELIQAQDLLVERREYVAYLGSINLQLGMELPLNEKVDFQLALFAEKSMIDLGFDNQDLTLVGLRSSILFGK